MFFLADCLNNFKFFSPELYHYTVAPTTLPTLVITTAKLTCKTLERACCLRTAAIAVAFANAGLLLVVYSLNIICLSLNAVLFTLKGTELNILETKYLIICH